MCGWGKIRLQAQLLHCLLFHKAKRSFQHSGEITTVADRIYNCKGAAIVGKKLLHHIIYLSSSRGINSMIHYLSEPFLLSFHYEILRPSSEKGE